MYTSEKSLEHESVFDRLSGALALEGSRGVGGIAHHRYVADGVRGGGEVVTHGPSGQTRTIEELDETVRLLAPAAQEAVKLFGGGWHDPLVAAPVWSLKVYYYRVQNLAEVGGVAENRFACKAVSAIASGSRRSKSRRTGTAKHHRVLRVLSTQFLHRLVHWNKSSIGDRARKDGVSSHVALSEEILAYGAVDAVRSNDGIRRCSRAVLEVEKHAAAFFFLGGLEALVEVCTFSRHSFDKLVEELSAVYASHAALSLLGSECFAFMLACALIEKDRVSIFQMIHKALFHGLQNISLTTMCSVKTSA